jgi:hypothetical protein
MGAWKPPDVGRPPRASAREVGDQCLGSRPFAIARRRIEMADRTFLGSEWRPRRVCFAYDAPADRSIHERVFGCNVAFGYDFNGIVCARADLEVVNAEADPEVARLARQMLAAQPGFIAAGILGAQRVLPLVPAALQYKAVGAARAGRTEVTSASPARSWRRPIGDDLDRHDRRRRRQHHVMLTARFRAACRILTHVAIGNELNSIIPA